jgi:hypothetical protein
VVTSGVALSVVALSGVASACPSGGTATHANDNSSTTAHGTSTQAKPAQAKTSHTKTSHTPTSHSSAASSHQSSGTAGTSGNTGSAQPVSKADSNSGGANGQCPGGPYCSTRDGSLSGNGNGGGKATGKPCAGCVGKADNKNPKGQMPNGSDHNAGYECDRNHGIGRTNPAHTGCKPTPVTVPVTCPAGQDMVEGTCVTPPVSCPAGEQMIDGTCLTPEVTCPAGSEMVDGACVLGDSFDRPGEPTSSTPETAIIPSVLGERVVRTPASAAVAASATTLPFTGIETGELLGLAALAMTAGGAFALAGRRRNQA